MEERFNEPISPEKVRIQTDLMEAIKISSEEERLRRLAEAKKGKEEETLQLVCVDWFDELTEGRIVRLHVSNQAYKGQCGQIGWDIGKGFLIY